MMQLETDENSTFHKRGHFNGAVTTEQWLPIVAVTLLYWDWIGIRPPTVSNSSAQVGEMGTGPVLKWVGNGRMVVTGSGASAVSV